MNLSIRNYSRQRMAIFLVLVALACSLLTTAATPALMTSSRLGRLGTHSQGKMLTFLQKGITPPSDAQCRAQFGIPCYSPQEIRRAYGIDSFINAGYTGRDQSIVIIDSFGSPTIAHDLHNFDKAYDLPDPPSLKILAPLGSVPFDPNNGDMITWAVESTLDVEWAHAIAPGASIVLLTSPVAETEGTQGLPEFLALEQYALDRHLGQIISQSWGATENTLFTSAGEEVIEHFESFYRLAASENVTIFASAGDTGSANVDINGNNYPFPTVSYPASSPWVTTVGGTSLFADTTGNYQSETVWNDQTGASGGGISQFFSIPAYQENNLPVPVLHQLASHRGIPDVSYNADLATSIPIYLSFVPGFAGFVAAGGTSAGAPQWAGIAAIADQVAGRPLGFLNSALYQIGNSPARDNAFHDITVGNNSFAGVPGYQAEPGWDLATGWGTPRLSIDGDTTKTLINDLISVTSD